MNLTFNSKANSENFEDAVRLMFNKALVKLFNSFYQASDIFQLYHGNNSANIADLAHVSSLAETARTAKAELEQLAADYSIDYDPKRIRIAPMHDYVCVVEKNMWSKKVA